MGTEGLPRDLGVAYPRPDGQGRLWISTMRSVPTIPGDQSLALRAFRGPLGPGTEPVKNFCLGRLETKDGAALVPRFQDFVYFAPVGTGDRIWIAEENGGRVLRLVNVDGEEDRSRGPYVDVVLRKPDLTPQDFRHSPRKISADSLWIVSGMRLDAEGHLWVLDKPTGDDGVGTRLLRFAAEDIPDRPPQTVFGIKARAVYGTGGRRKLGPCWVDSGVCRQTPEFLCFAGCGKLALSKSPNSVGDFEHE